MNPRRLASGIAITIILLLWPFVGARACGPFFEPDIFVKESFPDNLETFNRGHLGILQSGFDSNEYAVAYRYLNGGTLSDEQLREMGPQPAADQKSYDDEEPPKAWLTERSHYITDPAPSQEKTRIIEDAQGNIVFNPNYPNCPNAAFVNAVNILDRRAHDWGEKNPWLLDWIHGQDAVFANCSSNALTMPSVAPANSPTLLRADRAYQLASANLYAKRYDQASQQFVAIAKDKNSPWNEWGQYLAARATVRKAFAMGKATDPYGGELATFDLPTMQTAQKMLEALLAQSNPTPSRKIVVDELQFVRMRTEPEKRLSEICAALAGPGPDANFEQDRKDLDYVLRKSVPITDPPPLLAWIQAFRNSNGTNQIAALRKKNPSLPWLVIALVKAAPSDAQVPALLTEAQAIKPDSPAYDTTFFHRVRLLTGRNQYDEARSLLDKALPALHREQPSSRENALRGQRMELARNFDEFLTYAPRRVVERGSDTSDNASAYCESIPKSEKRPNYCPKQGGPPPPDESLEFDEDAANVLDRSTPLSMLVEAASSPILPANLRRDLTLAGWTRSVVLEDQANAAKFAPLLPKSLRDAVGTSIGFPATLAILRSPGLRPHISAGASRFINFNSLDDYRNNWWADGRGALSKEQGEQGLAEYNRLLKLPAAASLLGKRVLDYAKDHPSDPQVPEALALTVRANHYSERDPQDKEGEAKYSQVSKAAFEMLHHRYPKSPWTLKTRYYY